MTHLCQTKMSTITKLRMATLSRRRTLKREQEESEWVSEGEAEEDERYHEHARRYDINIKNKPHRRSIRRPPAPPSRIVPRYSQLRPRPDNDALGLIFSFLSSHHHFEDIRRVNRQWYRVATTRATSAVRTAIFDAQLTFRQLLKQEFQLSPINPRKLPKKVISLSFDQRHPLLDSLCATKYPDFISLSYSSLHNHGNLQVVHSEEYHLSHAWTLSNQLMTLILDPREGSCRHFPPVHSFHRLRVLLINSSPSYYYAPIYTDFASDLAQLHSLECLKLAKNLVDTKTCAVLRYLSSQHSLSTLDIDIEAESLKPIYSRTRTKLINAEKKQDEAEEKEEQIILSDYTDPASIKLLPHSRLTSLTLRVSTRESARWTRSLSEQIFVNLPHLRHFGCFVEVEPWCHKESVEGRLSAKNTDQLESMHINIEYLVDQQRLGILTNLRRLKLNLYLRTGCLTWMQSLPYLQELTIWTYYGNTFNADSYASLASLLSLERLSLSMALTVDQLDVIAASLSQLSHFMILRVDETNVQHLSSAFLTSMAQSLMWRQIRLDAISTFTSLFTEKSDGFRHLSSSLFSTPAMQTIRIRRYRSIYETKQVEIDVFRLVEKTMKGRYMWRFVPDEK